MWTIYYQHFGKENQFQQKRKYAADRLQRHLKETFLSPPLSPSTDHNGHPYMTIGKYIQHLSKLWEKDYYHVPHHFRVFYRNYIYPNEVQSIYSKYYGADIRMIDAILIDRDPSVEEHHRHRTRTFSFN